MTSQQDHVRIAFPSNPPLWPGTPQCAHQGHSTRQHYLNPSPSAWASRLRAMLRSPLSPSFSPPTFRPSSWRYSRHVAGARPHSVSCTAHTVRRVPHRASKICPPIMRHRCARQTTASAAIAVIPHLTGGAHARPSQAAVGDKEPIAAHLAPFVRRNTAL